MATYDTELNPILANASDEELRPIVGFLLKKMSNDIKNDYRYKDHPDEPSLYTDLISDEIRLMGGNTFVNLFRREGVSYHEVVVDVAEKMKVSFNKNSSTERIEELIIQKVFEDAWERMDVGEREEVIRDLGIGPINVSEYVVMGIQVLLKKGGFKTYQLAVIIANAIAKSLLGHGLSLTFNAGITKTLSFFIGPVGWILSGLWTMIDLAGPSYKTTIPCVIHIAMLRQKQMVESKPIT